MPLMEDHPVYRPELRPQNKSEFPRRGDVYLLSTCIENDISNECRSSQSFRGNR